MNMTIEMECKALGGLKSNTVVMNTQQALAAGLRNGSPIQLKGKRTSVGQLSFDDARVEQGQIGMGPTMRLNLRLKEGDAVSGEHILSMFWSVWKYFSLKKMKSENPETYFWTNQKKQEKNVV